MACQLSSSQRRLAGIVVSQPQRKFSWAGDASSANAAVARLSSGAAAARPSVTRVLRPSSSRSDGRSGPGRPRSRFGGTGYLDQAAGGGQATGEERSSPRVEVGLARKLGVEPLKALGSVQEQWRRSGPHARRERDLTPEQLHVRRLQLVWRRGLGQRQKLERALEACRHASSLGQRQAHAAPAARDRPTERQSDAGTRLPRPGRRAPARGRRTARAPRRPARWAPLRLWPDATRDGRGRRCRSVASARARWTSRRCSLVAVR